MTDGAERDLHSCRECRGVSSVADIPPMDDLILVILSIFSRNRTVESRRGLWSCSDAVVDPPHPIVVSTVGHRAAPTHIRGADMTATLVNILNQQRNQ